MDMIHGNELTQTDGSPASKDYKTDTPKPEQTRSAMNLLLLGTASGLLLHWLVWDRVGGGLGMLLWTVLSCAAVLWLNRHQNVKWRRELLCWTGLICSAAMLAVLREASVVTTLMHLVMLLCLGMVFFRARGHALADATIPSVVLTALHLPARLLVSIFPALDTVMKSQWKNGGQLSSVFRGVLLATPLLFIFMMLFASADAVFGQYLSRILHLMGDLSPSTPLITLIMIVLATGLLSCGIVQSVDNFENQHNSQSLRLWPGLTLQLGRTETAIVMGSLAMLFISFVLLQASYLFGGIELIELRSGLTLAKYARRGFFELLAVAALTLGVLMAIASTQCHQILFRRLGAVLISCVMIMLISAVYRLNMYIEYFGLTLARLVALAFMLWLAAGLLWFAATVLRGNARGFLAGFVITGTACFLIIAAINPAARVAELNINRAETYGRPLDIDYLTRLGSDAVPAIVPILNCRRTRYYYGQWAGLRGDGLTQRSSRVIAIDDWRDWNASRVTAHRLVSEKLQGC